MENLHHYKNALNMTDSSQKDEKQKNNKDSPLCASSLTSPLHLTAGKHDLLSKVKFKKQTKQPA